MTWSVDVGEGLVILTWTSNYFGDEVQTGDFFGLTTALKAAERHLYWTGVTEDRGRIRNAFGWLSRTDAIEVRMFETALRKYYDGGSVRVLEDVIQAQLLER